MILSSLSAVFPPGRGLWVLMAVLISVFVLVNWLDIPLASACQLLPADVQDFFQVVTRLGESTAYLIAAAFLFLYGRLVTKNRSLTRASLYAFTAVALSGLITDGIKWLAGRWRPKAFFTEGLYGFEFLEMEYMKNSFPSGHATTACALAFVLSTFFPRYRPLWWTIAAAVLISRVAIGSHYLSDVVMGAYIGILVAFLLKRVPFFHFVGEGKAGDREP